MCLVFHFNENYFTQEFLFFSRPKLKSENIHDNSICSSGIILVGFNYLINSLLW
ncbi:hypothetical protein HNQ88_001195 [Aureibacter tunicatorum]|uniref:Uncharacterized protein n=1 Tax=Aureibacter tunicatorum TaxID=866807 RepID=A0AAE3XNB6_9BACT|nr:hypothetical protein [Aureibacter tunicatorum]BDD03252.1 hypothetical protein AUTU_07350 [Aureibacter tunicatorum]